MTQTKPLAPLREGSPLQGLGHKNVFTRLWENYFDELNGGIYAASSHATDTNNPHHTSDANLEFSDITTHDVSASMHGFAPKASGDAKEYLDGEGAWKQPRLDEMEDVVITTPAQSDSLTYDDTQKVWVNVAVGGYVPATFDGSSTNIAYVATPFDGHVLTISETATTPGFSVEVTFNNVAAFTRINTHLKYSGNNNHRIQIQLYNTDSTNWDDVTVFTDQADLYQWITIDGIPSAKYINPTGKVVKVRFYHPAAGNASHTMDVDYVALVKGQ